MASNFFDNERVGRWLDQFRPGDRENARLLLSMVKLVSADEFASTMMARAARRTFTPFDWT